MLSAVRRPRLTAMRLFVNDRRGRRCYRLSISAFERNLTINFIVVKDLKG